MSTREPWYDQVVVDRLWAGKDAGRNPTEPEIEELLRLGQLLSDGELAERTGLARMTIYRWRRDRLSAQQAG